MMREKRRGRRERDAPQRARFLEVAEDAAGERARGRTLPDAQ